MKQVLPRFLSPVWPGTRLRRATGDRKIACGLCDALAEVRHDTRVGRSDRYWGGGSGLLST